RFGVALGTNSFALFVPGARVPPLDLRVIFSHAGIPELIAYIVLATVLANASLWRQRRISDRHLVRIRRLRDIRLTRLELSLVCMDRKEIRRADRFAQFAVAAAGQALQDAKLQITPDLAPRIGAAFGSGIGGVETLVDNILSHASDPRKVSPFMIPMMIIDM